MLGLLPHPDHLLCTICRMEVVDDDLSVPPGLHIDEYGDECGEWFSEKVARMGLKLGRTYRCEVAALVFCPTRLSGRICRRSIPVLLTVPT